MECEICGKQVSDNPTKAKIEGSVMIVCEECAKLGKIQKAPPKPKFRKSKKPKTKKTKQNYSKDEPKEELVEDFNIKIRKARESKNLSREELGHEIYEKVSVINRIESGKMIPDIRLTKKLENALNITLIENVEELDLSQYMGNSSQGRTLGNVVKIKKR
ncbi:multiprotein bridging factor aMBF1 [uncultured Methanobrevibacter sp.]|uniref:multiprotein bridging factor aMBF1 n=1 Tax=uncultured Methanobrevibacter sp. TaxID=253161 RepID=UPI0026168B8D|nr:multiprotein bridging factor aMBF1 [uncultured Methanobrevibacter sp.]